MCRAQLHIGQSAQPQERRELGGAWLSSAGSLIVSGIDLPTLEEDELNDDVQVIGF
jgi:hypothetical protein